jgi:hypothetical protein
MVHADLCRYFRADAKPEIYGFLDDATPRRGQGRVAPGRALSCDGFTVTNLSRPAERIVAFYNKRRTCEPWIEEGGNAFKWMRLSCCSFAANGVRLRLHALAYNLANFMRTLALL